jgi:hypothetical protein
MELKKKDHRDRFFFSGRRAVGGGTGGGRFSCHAG